MTETLPPGTRAAAPGRPATTVLGRPTGEGTVPLRPSVPAQTPAAETGRPRAEDAQTAETAAAAGLDITPLAQADRAAGQAAAGLVGNVLSADLGTIDAQGVLRCLAAQSGSIFVADTVRDLTNRQRAGKIGAEDYQTLVAMRGKFQENLTHYASAGLDKSIKVLQRDANPTQAALGFDLAMALNQQVLSNLEGKKAEISTQIASIVGAQTNGSREAGLNDTKTKLESKLEQMTATMTMLSADQTLLQETRRDKFSNTEAPSNQVVAMAVEFSKKGDTPLTEQQIQAIKDNPLAVISNTLGEAVIKADKRDALQKLLAKKNPDGTSSMTKAEAKAFCNNIGINLPEDIPMDGFMRTMAIGATLAALKKMFVDMLAEISGEGQQRR